MKPLNPQIGGQIICIARKNREKNDCLFFDSFYQFTNEVEENENAPKKKFPSHNIVLIAFLFYILNLHILKTGLS